MRHVDEDRLESDVAYRFAYLTEFMGFTDEDVATIHAAAPVSSTAPRRKSRFVLSKTRDGVLNKQTLPPVFLALIGETAWLRYGSLNEIIATIAANRFRRI